MTHKIGMPPTLLSFIRRFYSEVIHPQAYFYYINLHAGIFPDSEWC